MLGMLGKGGPDAMEQAFRDGQGSGFLLQDSWRLVAITLREQLT